MSKKTPLLKSKTQTWAEGKFFLAHPVDLDNKRLAFSLRHKVCI